VAKRGKREASWLFLRVPVLGSSMVESYSLTEARAMRRPVQCMLMRIPFSSSRIWRDLLHVWTFCWMLGLRLELFRDPFETKIPAHANHAPSLYLYAKLHNQFHPGPFYEQHSNNGFGLSVERFEPRERTRSCINDAALLRDRSSSQLYLVLVKPQECARLLLH
jgi:hypothetical protein